MEHPKYGTLVVGAFGSGQDSTREVIDKQNASDWGEQDKNFEGYKDLWGPIQTKIEDIWFIPSKVEWAAFAGELEIKEDNYRNKGLCADEYNVSVYWSSTPRNGNAAWGANFSGERIYDYATWYPCYVRLSTTF